ncbi:MAG TPA: hypothetical protein VIV60_04145, partial [Polyangiaceae bacterium]
DRESKLLGLLTLIPALRNACEVARVLAIFRDREFNLDRNLDRLLVHAHTHAHALDRNLALALDRDFVLNRHFSRSFDLDRNRAIDNAFNRRNVLEHKHTFERNHAIDRVLARTLDLDHHLDHHFDLDLAIALALDLDMTVDRYFPIDRDLEAAPLAELWQAHRRVDRSQWRSPGTQLPMDALSRLLRLAHRHSEESVGFFDKTVKETAIRRKLGRSKSSCRRIAQYYAVRTRTVERLSAWAALYAAREKTGHPGWEGLRIVCETRF